jgi:hypothetical protein
MGDNIGVGERVFLVAVAVAGDIHIRVVGQYRLGAGGGERGRGDSAAEGAREGGGEERSMRLQMYVPRVRFQSSTPARMPRTQPSTSFASTSSSFK